MSEPVLPRLKVSPEGMVLIQSFEGFRPRAVRREDGRWVIGYGHTRSAREGATVSEADAELLLHYDLIAVADAINDGVKRPVNQHQFDALASFAFSVGLDRFAASDVLQRLNAGGATQAADAMVGWPEPVSPETPLRRRIAERALFTADPAAPVALSDLLSAPLPPLQIAVAPDSDAVAQARAAAVASLLGEDLDPVFKTGDYQPATRDPARSATDVPSEPERLTTPTATLEPTKLPASAPAIIATSGLAGLLPGDAAPNPALGPAPSDAVHTPVASPAPPLTTTGSPTAVPVTGDVLSDLARRAVDQVSRERPAAPPGFGSEHGLAEQPLLNGEPQSAHAPDPVLRHEAPAEPATRFDWGETGAFLIMGGVGLVSFGISMAALRLASQQSTGSDETAMIGWALAIIGASSVGVSSLNLYRRWRHINED